MTRFAFAAPVFLLTALAWTGPASAQAGEESVNQLIVYGDDPCPVSTDAQITVCARKDEAERYRIPEALRQSQSPENDAWVNRVIAYETVLDSGTQSCSPTGAGGWTGCLGQFINTAYKEKENAPAIRFSELIAEERAKRLSTIDETAAEHQARVEEEEKQYFEKQENDAQPGERSGDPSSDAAPAGE